MNQWNQIVGHDWAVETLRSAIQHERVGHAYLITGPAQVGKTTLARTFAQALNCQAADVAARPCGRCRSCQLIAADRHPDVRLLQPELSSRGKPTIKIDQMRTLQHDLSLAAYEGRWKVAILRQFDAANVSAANAFLKTLEEPPKNVVLLLTAADAESLLPTVGSRCRHLPLRPLPLSTIIDALQSRWQVAPPQAELLAHLADGRLGWAVQAATNTQLRQARTERLEQLQTILAGSLVERFQLADKLANKAEELPPLLQTWVTWWRDLALVAWQQSAHVVHIDQLEAMRPLATAWGKPILINSLKQTQAALWQLQHNANTRLVLENLFLQLPQM